MRIVSCHINNYGVISNKDYDFSNDITCLYELNGTGKTTLASFIKAMLYGLKTSKSKGIDERKHYYPFNGGIYGGSIIIESDNKTYRIERTFHEKTQTRDKLTIRDENNKIIDLDSPNLGEYLFGIDEEGFSKTIFITSKDIEVSTNTSINSKLNNIVDKNQEENYDKVIKKLEDTSKEYKAKRGNGGKINELNDEIIKCEDDISSLEELDSSLSEKYNTLKTYRDRLTSLENNLSKTNEIRVNLSYWERYEELEKKIAEQKKLIDDINHKYPQGLMREDDLYLLKQINQKVNDFKSKLENLEFSEHKIKLYNNYKSKFQTFEIEKLNDHYTKTQELNKLKNEYQSGIEKEQEIERSEQKYTPEVRDYLQSQIKKYYDLESELQTSKNKKSSVSTVYIALSIVSLVVLLVGVVLLFVHTGVGLALTIIGAVAFGCCLALIIKKSRHDQQMKDGDVNYLSTKINQLDIDIHQSFKDLNVDSEDYNISLKLLDNKIQELADNKNDLTKSNQEIKEKILKLQNELYLYYRQYDLFGEDYLSLNIELNNQYNEYQRLSHDEQELNEKKQSYVNSIDEYQKNIVDICDKYNLQMTGSLEDLIQEVVEDNQEYARLSKDIIENQKKNNEFQKEHQLYEKPDCQSALSLDIINNDISLCNQKIASLENQIDQDEIKTRMIPELKDKLEKLKETKKAYEDKYNLINNTIKYLEDAEDNLKKLYINPIKDKYVEYIKNISSSLSNNVVMNYNYEVMYDTFGSLKEVDYLSEGQKTCLYLALRFSIIENMYTEEKPFVIMDDPFVHLDEKHFNNVQSLLKDLSKYIQIIYFTCHPSRVIS